MKLQTLFKAGVCIAAAPGLSYSGSAFAEVKDNTLRLDPSSPWNLVYADDSCRIMRVFGEDDQRVAFYIERFEPGDSFSMLAAGKPLRNIARRDFAHVRFGELHSEAEVRLTPGSLPEFEPALIFNTTRFDVADDDDDQRTDGNAASGPDIFGQQIAPETEAAINWISIRGRSRRTVVLNTGSMGAPMEAVRACTDNLMELTFDTTEPAFLAGFLAAGSTNTGVVATYAGINIEPLTLSMDGFAAGVRHYNREAGTSVELLGWDGNDGQFVGSE